MEKEKDHKAMIKVAQAEREASGRPSLVISADKYD